MTLIFVCVCVQDAEIFPFTIISSLEAYPTTLAIWYQKLISCSQFVILVSHSHLVFGLEKEKLYICLHINSSSHYIFEKRTFAFFCVNNSFNYHNFLNKFAWDFKLLACIVQVVSSQLFTADAQVQFQVSPCVINGG